MARGKISAEIKMSVIIYIRNVSVQMDLKFKL